MRVWIDSGSPFKRSHWFTVFDDGKTAQRAACGAKYNGRQVTRTPQKCANCRRKEKWEEMNR